MPLGSCNSRSWLTPKDREFIHRNADRGAYSPSNKSSILRTGAVDTMIWDVYCSLMDYTCSGYARRTYFKSSPSEFAKTALNWKNQNCVL